MIILGPRALIRHVQLICGERKETINTGPEDQGPKDRESKDLAVLHFYDKNATSYVLGCVAVSLLVLQSALLLTQKMLLDKILLFHIMR